jgi:hypothetical protein
MVRADDNESGERAGRHRVINPISPKNENTNKVSTDDQAQAKPIVVQGNMSHAKTDPQSDIVQISNSAQAKMLKQQGLTVSQIAVKMGLDAKTVSTYLPSIDSKA